MSSILLSSSYFTSIYVSAKAESMNLVRSRNFLIIMLAMAILAMVFFPNVQANYQTISIANYRGTYNSAWIGDTLAMLNISFLPFICFYYIRGSIQADKISKRSELIASTSINKTQIILAKWLSNLFVMSCFLVWMIAVAIVMQLWLQEDISLNLIDIAVPQLLHVLPIFMILAGIILLFDSLKITSSSVGNVLYFFLCSFSLVAAVYYLSGTDQIIEQMVGELSALSGKTVEGITIGISSIKEGRVLNQFVWQGADYSTFSLLPLLHSVLLAGAILLLSITCFDRYKTSSNVNGAGNDNRFVRFISKNAKKINTLLSRMCAPFIFTNIAYQEAKLLVSEKSYWWSLSLIILWLVQWLLPLNIVVEMVLPASFLVAGLMLASLGQREEEHKVSELLGSVSVLMSKQFPAMFLAAVALLVLTISGAVFRLIASGDLLMLFAVMSGAILISALAIFLGTIFKTARVFEIIYTLFWYMGPMSRFEYFDYIGISNYQNGLGPMPLIFIVCAGLLLLCAFIVRKKQFS